jgi:hypothetical protein
MFIDPDFLKTATYIVEDGDPVSTVFFVRVPLFHPRVPVSHDNFAVTTRHSVKDAEVSIRFNLKGGGIHDEPISQHDWIHSTETDVSILPLRFPLDSFDIKFVESWEVSPDRDYLISIEPHPYRSGPQADETTLMQRYGTGDEVFSVGLFPGFPGENIARPAARFGHIALKPAPGEKILADMGGGEFKPIEAFLVEIAALGGQSGSPVFLRLRTRQERDAPGALWEMSFLVGMVQGFYPIEHDARLQGRKFKLTVDTGLCIVIPTQDIVKMLMEDSLVKDREKRLEEVRKERAKMLPTTASVQRQPSPQEQGFTQEGFEEALRRASRKVPQPDAEQGEE